MVKLRRELKNESLQLVREAYGLHNLAFSENSPEQRRFCKDKVIDLLSPAEVAALRFTDSGVPDRNVRYLNINFCFI